MSSMSLRVSKSLKPAVGLRWVDGGSCWLLIGSGLEMKITVETTISNFVGGGGRDGRCSVTLFANVNVHKSETLFGPRPFIGPLCPCSLIHLQGKVHRVDSSARGDLVWTTFKLPQPCAASFHAVSVVRIRPAGPSCLVSSRCLDPRSKSRSRGLCQNPLESSCSPVEGDTELVLSTLSVGRKGSHATRRNSHRYLRNLSPTKT